MKFIEKLILYWALNPDLEVSSHKVTQSRIIGISRRGLMFFVSAGAYVHRQDTVKPHLRCLSSMTDVDLMNLFNVLFENNGEEISKEDTYKAWVAKGWAELYEMNINSPRTYGLTDKYLKGEHYLRSKGYNLDFEEGQYIKI